MPMNAEELGVVVRDLLAQHRKEKPRLDRIADYLANRVVDIYVPRKATQEYQMLVDQARFNVLPLVVKSLAQNLFVDGYRPTGENGRAPTTDNAPIWDTVWQPNRMDARQAMIHRSAIKFGYSYAVVLPGEPAPEITPYSPRKLTAIYDDEVNDEWPRYAMVAHQPPYQPADPTADPLAAKPDVTVGVRLTIYDDQFRYEVIKTEAGWVTKPEVAEHGLGVVPVVRFLDEQDCDEIPPGKVWPLLPTPRPLNQTTLGLLMDQPYAAFKQRWVTGMAIDDDSEPFNARVDAMLQGESTDTKFGEFSETNLDGYLNSREKTLLFVAAVAQMVPHTLVTSAGISNISAEALAALSDAARHDIGEHQTSFGESHEQLLRLAGKALGTDEGNAAWADTSAQVVWRDTTPRSLAQVADALGKMATMLEVPVEALWEMIPNVTDQDIERWKDMRPADLMSELEGVIGRDTPSDQGEAADIKAKADALGALVRAGAEFGSSAAKVGLRGLESSGAVPTTLRLPETDAAALETA